MIKELNDLVHFVKTSIWRDEALLAFFSKNNPDLLRLYRAIWSQNLATDEAAARAAGTGLTTYKKLARILRKHLREMAVFFDDEKAKVDITVKNYAEGALDQAVMQLLHARGYRHAPLQIAKRLYRRGYDYEAPAFMVEALRVLKESVLSVGGSDEQFAQYSAEYWTCRAWLEAEERAADCYQWAKLPYLRSKSIRKDLQEETRRRLDALEPFKGKIPSYMFHVYYYIVRGNFLQESGEFEAALSCYEEAIAYFRQKNYPVVNPLAMFFYSKVPAYLMLGQYAEGEAAALAALDYAPEGSFNFFNAYEMYFYLAMHTGHYAQALDIFQTATLHKRFGNLRPPQQETWHILGAYLFVLYRMKDWELPEKSLPAFRSCRFANETPVFNRDKTGMNVAIQIVFMFLQLLEGREDEVLERIQSLDKYRSRHLRDAGADRSELFIRILAQLPRAAFKPDAFLRRARPLLEHMARLPRQLTNHNCELEIIPYETLTQEIAGYLRNKDRRPAEIPREWRPAARRKQIGSNDTPLPIADGIARHF